MLSGRLVGSLAPKSLSLLCRDVDVMKAYMLEIYLCVCPLCASVRIGDGRVFVDMRVRIDRRPINGQQTFIHNAVLRLCICLWVVLCVLVVVCGQGRIVDGLGCLAVSDLRGGLDKSGFLV